MEKSVPPLRETRREVGERARTEVGGDLQTTEFSAVRSPGEERVPNVQTTGGSEGRGVPKVPVTVTEVLPVEGPDEGSTVDMVGGAVTVNGAQVSA